MSDKSSNGFITLHKWDIVVNLPDLRGLMVAFGWASRVENHDADA